MSGEIAHALDRWLVVSEPAFRALAGHWRAEAGNGSLLDWRFRNALIEAVSPSALERRIETLSTNANANISLIVETLEPALLETLERLSGSVSLRLFEWQVSPLSVVLAANAPDTALLFQLEHGPNAQADMAAPVARTIPERTRYRAALRGWEAQCRAGDADAFFGVYPFAGAEIMWDALIDGGAGRGAANDNVWINIPLLAASTSRGLNDAMVLADPEHEPALWDITLAPIDEGPQMLVRFRAVGLSSAAFVGKRVLVRADGRTIDLGTVDETGRASVVLETPIKPTGMAVAITDG